MDLRIDSTKIQFWPHWLARWDEAKDDWWKAKTLHPLYVEISPMGACNHRCTFCATDFLGYQTRSLNHEALVLALASMAQNGVKSVMFAGEGEPLLYKKLDDAIACATSYGLKVAITTNGVLLAKLRNVHKCEWIKVSVNAGTKETYAKVHRTSEEDWKRVWLGIKDAAARKGNCTIGVQMVVLPENEGEWHNLVAHAHLNDADYVVLKPYSQHKSSLTTEYADFRQSWPAVPPSHRGMAIYTRDDAPSHDEQRYTRCFATPNAWAYVMASGDVYTCSAFLLDERFKIGSIHERSWREVWESDERRKNFEMMKSFDIRDCRKNCRMHKTNEHLWDLAQGVEHQAFI